MPTTFRPCAPNQSLLFPPSPRDWLPEGHLAFFIADTVAAVNLHVFYEPYEGDGRRNQPFDPRMMVTVLLYAYATGTFSSRWIARKLEDDVAYRVLAAGSFPAHRTIAEFRQQHLAAFETLFVQVVAIAREAGVVKLGALVVDGCLASHNQWWRHIGLWLPPLLYMVVIFHLSSESNPLPLLTPHVWDKALHGLEYGGLGFLLCRALRGEGFGWSAALTLALVATSAYGASDEWHQLYTPGRTADVHDWMADTFGAVVSLAAYVLVASTGWKLPSTRKSARD